MAISYHFPAMKVNLLDNAFNGAASDVSQDKPSIVVVQILGPCKAKLDIGWHSLTYLTKEEDRVLKLVADQATGTCLSACLLIPFPAGEKQDYRIEVKGKEAVVTIQGSHPVQRKINL